MGLLDRLGPALRATLGSERAKGELETLDVTRKLKADWDRYLGQTRQERSASTLIEFMDQKYNVIVEMDSSTDRMSNEQVDRHMTVFARQLLAQGAVTYEPYE